MGDNLFALHCIAMFVVYRHCHRTIRKSNINEYTELQVAAVRAHALDWQLRCRTIAQYWYIIIHIDGERTQIELTNSLSMATIAH